MKEAEEIIYDKIYENQVGEYNILDREKLDELFKKMQILEGKEREKIREKIILHNLRLPLYVARKMATKGIDVKELESEGTVGLIEAVDKYKYDYESGASFSTFAIKHIKYKLITYLRNHSRLIRLPNYITEFAHKYNQLKCDLAVKLGRYPTKKELADALDISLRSFYQMEKQAQDMLYLDERMNKENVDKSATYLDMLSSEEDDMEELITKLSLEELEKALRSDKLKRKDIEVLKTRYGYYNDSKPVSCNEVAEMFEYSSPRSVGYVEERAIKELRRVLISPRNKVDFPICE